MIQLKRLSDPPAAEDGARVFAERAWPRGVEKDAAKLEEWSKDAAPTDLLRDWFAADAGKRDTFRKRYFKELSAKPKEKLIERLLQFARRGMLTLLHTAADETLSSAAALKDYLEGVEA
jgi:uncharacterized protein YeaO (DUF488 family)